jgi:hypothetical protein
MKLLSAKIMKTQYRRPQTPNLDYIIIKIVTRPIFLNFLLLEIKLLKPALKKYND